MCKSPERGHKWSMADPYHIQPTIPHAFVSLESSEQKAGVHICMQALNGWHGGELPCVSGMVHTAVRHVVS